MKVAAVYTGITDELKEMVEGALREKVGEGVEVLEFKDPTIIKECNEAGRVTEGCARRLMDMYEMGVKSGAEVLFNICSSVGDVAKAAQPLYAMTGVTLVRIDESMAMDAVKRYSRIGVLATLKSTLEPTKRLLSDCAAQLGKPVTLVDALADGAFGLNRAQFTQALTTTALKVAPQVDVLLFAQGSMAYAQPAIESALGLPVLSSIEYGADAVKAAVEGRRGRRTRG